MKAVCSWSGPNRGIWWYPEYASRKLIISCLAADSTSWSILGMRKMSLGYALFRSMKTTQTLHFPFFFLTTIGLETHSRNWASLITLTFSSSALFVPLPQPFLAPFSSASTSRVWSSCQYGACDTSPRPQFLACPRLATQEYQYWPSRIRASLIFLLHLGNCQWGRTSR